MEKMNFLMNPFMGDMKFVRVPLKSSCLMVPWYLLSFLCSAGAAVIIGFSTEWDIGFRSEAKRKFYEYYSSGAVLCFASLFFFYVIGRIILVLYIVIPLEQSSSSGNISSSSGNSSSSEESSSGSWEDNKCIVITLYVTILGAILAVVFVLFGLVMDEVIKIPTFVLTIIGAVVEGIIILKSCCCDGCCSENHHGCCITTMRMLANLIDLGMFILWTIKLATSSLALPYIAVGILKVVASVLSVVADFISSAKEDGFNCSLVLVSLCSATGIVSQSVLIPLRADGYINVHYVWCTMVVSIGFTLFALVVLCSGCCGYTLMFKEDNDNEVQKVEDQEMS